ncbi:MAG: sigma 54-interacting transcriptional regulator, partial [Dokdonella sp.]|uniref:sigma-54-dependent Fis family transcriptional regulator n=1 Tax=Dokdonella sp. TaxID=2291710 RepID=UPI003265A55E
LSGEASVHHIHALGMVRLAVDQIEHRLFDHLCRDRDVIRVHSDAALLGTAREGLLVFEGHMLVAANRHALELLGLGWGEFGRRRYDELFSGALPAAGGSSMLRDHLGTHLHARRNAKSASIAVTHKCEASTRVQPARAPRPYFDDAQELQLQRATRLLDADIPVLLLGETGTGKEVFARELHRRSARAKSAFVAVNCAALPESLIESELFGYVTGAFTGARREGAPGLLRQAHGGVLFLDEIGDMPLSMQSRLLRVIQEREITPLGGGRTMPVDFRLVSATHCDLQAAIDAKTFRPDLYYRIAQNTFNMPKLCERGDRGELIASLWSSLGATAAGMRLAPAALELLVSCPWPGNFRQLVGVLRTLIALGERQSTIGVDRLPDSVRRPVVPQVAQVFAAGVVSSMNALRHDAMCHALEQSGGNTSAAARRLGVSRSTFYRQLQKH